MKITQKELGKYITRSKKLAEDDQYLVTSIIRVDEVNNDGSFVGSLIHNCQPIYTLNFIKDNNDDGWHDVTDMVFQANSVIPIPANTCNYDSNTAAMYRNYMKELQSLKPMDPKLSAGSLAVIGTRSRGVIKFSDTADQIIAVDDDGFIITYGGFCPHNVTEEDIVMRVIKLDEETEALYNANEVVTLSNTVHSSDIKTAYEMAITAKANIKPNETVSETIAQSQGIQKLNLQGN